MRRWRTERLTEKRSLEEEKAGTSGRIKVITSISIIPNGSKDHQLCHSVTPRSQPRPLRGRDVVLPIL